VKTSFENCEKKCIDYFGINPTLPKYGFWYIEFEKASGVGLKKK